IRAADRERALQRSVEERTRELAVLYEASRTIGSAPRYEELLPHVMDALHALLDFDLAVCLLEHGPRAETSIHVARPLTEACRQPAVAAAREAFRALAGRPAPAAPEEVRPLAVFEPWAALVPEGLGSRASVPLVRRGAVAGVIAVFARRRGAFADAG